MARKAARSDFAVPVGDYIQEWIDDHDTNQGELADRMGVVRKHLNRLINGHVALTPDVALKLEQATGVPASYWNKMEAGYREAKARLDQEKELAVHRDLVDQLGTGVRASARKWGILSSNSDLHRPGLVIQDLFEFFGCSSVDRLRRELFEPEYVAAWRKDSNHQVNPAATAIWLRLAHNEAAEAHDDAPAAPFDATKLQKTLPSIRELSTREAMLSDDFVDKLQALLLSCGVGLVLCPEITGSRAYGVTIWEDGQPIIVLSLRGKNDGQFWFTLFHEIGHILLHPGQESDPSFDAKREPTAQEHEADVFASDILYPPEYRDRMARLGSLQDVQTLAEAMGTSPGVIVGYLHHNEIWPHDRGNRLRIQMNFAEKAS
jgi:HTH-type transcriptional regulator/antitoxin HigA